MITDDQGTPDFGSIEEAIHAYFAAKHSARETSLALTRLVIRNAGNAIRAVHRRDLTTAQTLLEASTRAATDARDAVHTQQALLQSGYLHDALKELAEAALFVALVEGHALPTPTELELEWPAYLAGLAETVGGLRRYALDALRRDEPATAEATLAQMSAIYELLIGLDYPDAVTGGLRHATDGARAILERTRGDITTAVQQRRLEWAIRQARAAWEPRDANTPEGTG